MIAQRFELQRFVMILALPEYGTLGSQPIAGAAGHVWKSRQKLWTPRSRQEELPKTASMVQVGLDWQFTIRKIAEKKRLSSLLKKKVEV